MKIIYIPGVAEKYGASESFREMVVTLKEKYEIEPIVLTSKKDKIYEFAKKNKIEVYAIHYKEVFYQKSDCKIKNTIKKVVKKIKEIENYIEENNDINKLKKIIDLRQVDIIHSNIERVDIGALISKKYNIPHIMHLREFADKDYDVYPIYEKKYMKIINKYTQVFIAISDVIKDHWSKKGIENEKIIRVYNGINNKKFVSKSKFDDGYIHIIFSGSLWPTKGQMEAVKAIRQLPSTIKDKIKLDIYGDGNKEYIQKIKEYIKENQLENIIKMKGYNSEIFKVIGKYDIGIMCSKSEAFGRTTAEYMNAGLCVIASNGGANSELIKNNVTGLTYKHGDTRDLANKIKYAIENKEEREKLSRNAMEYASNNFTSEINAKNIFNIYKEIMKEKE